MRIIMVSTTRYPSISAETIRLHYLAKLLCECGYDVRVVCRGGNQPYEQGVFDGIPYQSLNYISQFDTRIRKGFDLARFSFRLNHYLKRQLNFDFVVILGVQLPTFMTIIRYTKKRRIPLLYDCVEWYSPEQFKHGRLTWAYIEKELYMRMVCKYHINVISISSYLHNHFIKNGIRSIRIPVIIDTKAILPKRPTNNSDSIIRFVYIGSPGKKDRLDTFIDACVSLPEAMRHRVHICLAGITPTQLTEQCGVNLTHIEQLGDSLSILGKVPHEDVAKLYAAADFSLLFRPLLRYAQAGFPTKVVESMANCTPVFCNLTSDLGQYLEDGKNALIAESYDSDSIRISLYKILRMDSDSIDIMSQNVRETAKQSFDYHLFCDGMSAFLKNLMT